MTTKKIMVVANDLGYGEVKASIDEQYINQPSVVSEVTQVTSDPIDHTNKNQVKATVDDLLNNLDITLDKRRYLVGNLAFNSTLGRTGFDINSNKGKANTNLAMILPLSFIAGRAVQKAYKSKQDIFEPISVKAVMTTALPIDEIGIGSADKRDEYANKFLKTKHVVILNNFDTPINVTIEFKDVRVYKEGEVATAIAIQNGPDELSEALKQDIQENYPDRDEDTIENIISSAKNLLGIDIGQGTTDLALTTNGSADVYNSTSIAQGYGTIMRSAWKYLKKMPDGFPVKDTLEFSKILNSNPTNDIDQAKKETALKAVKASTSNLVGAIKQNLNDILIENNQLEVVYVFGGGSIPLSQQTDLREQLEDALKQYRSSAVLVWVDKEYAQKLNEIGLKMLADALGKTI